MGEGTPLTRPAATLSPRRTRGEGRVRIPRTLISRLVPVNRNAAFRRQPAAGARVAEILERSLQAAARSDPANARRTFQAARRGESPSSVNAAFHRRFMGRGAAELFAINARTCIIVVQIWKLTQRRKDAECN